jgi:hypothetical protein
MHDYIVHNHAYQLFADVIVDRPEYISIEINNGLLKKI